MQSGQRTVWVVSSDGTRLAVDTYGERQRPAIVLLHGFPESRLAWRPLAERLADTYYVVVPDGRGINESEVPQDMAAYAIHQLVADVCAVIDDCVGAQPVLLVGHDWGGVVAWSVASVAPQYVSHLLVVSGPHPEILRQVLATDADQRRASAYIERLCHPDAPAVLLANACARLHALFPDGMLSVAQRQAYAAAWERPGCMAAALAWYRAATFAHVGGGCDVPLPPVSLPMTLVWGMQDGALLPVLAEAHLAQMPGLTLLLQPDAGHWWIHTHREALEAGIRAIMPASLLD